MMEHGINVALGTDSLASNPDLDILAEARFLRTHRPEVSGETLLRMLTLHGARAFGAAYAQRFGSLSPGKDANFVVLPVLSESVSDPHDLLFRSDAAPAAVYFRGVANP
jgi:cytosine/adenosine deaminase-related metal-dependent hydrolase